MLRRGVQVNLPSNMTRIGDVLYSARRTLASINLNEPGFIIRERMTLSAIRGGEVGLVAVNGTLYAVGLGGGAYKLWSINLATRVMTEIGATGRDLGTAVGMAAIGSTVYVSDASADTVLTIDLATARVTPLPNPLGVSITTTIGMFSIGTTLYLSTGRSRLYTVDTNTGVAARVTAGVLRGNTGLESGIVAGRFPEPGAKVFADGPRSLICRTPGASHIIGVR